MSRFSLGWHNAEVNPKVASILDNIVVSNDVDGYVAHYDSIRAATPQLSMPAEMQLVLHLRDSQAHAARNFRERMGYLIAELPSTK